MSSLLKSQTNYNQTKELFTTDGEYLNQSVTFEKSFVLDKVYIRFEDIRIDPINDVKFRIEVRGNISPDNLIDLSLSPLVFSSWTTDSALDPDAPGPSYFDLNSFELSPGTYWFSIVPNRRCTGNLISYQRGGEFTEKFLHYKYGTGMYRTDCSLYLDIWGWWGTEVARNTTLEEANIVTTLRDET